MNIFDGDKASKTMDLNPIPYSRYLVLATYIKLLNDYMKQQKPSSFLALWHDKRDSNA